MPDTEPSLIYSYKMSRDDCKKTDCTNARFGFSLATLDVDLDNYEGRYLFHYFTSFLLSYFF